MKKSRIKLYTVCLALAVTVCLITALVLHRNSPEVRLRAIELLDTVEIEGGSGAEADIIAKSLTDQSADVRSSALSILLDKPKCELNMVAEVAIKSPHQEIKEEILNELARHPTISRVTIMITGLRDNDPDFREDVQGALDNITDQQFQSPEEAEQWWAANQYKFEKQFNDENLEEE